MTGFGTRAIHAGLDADPVTGAIVPPLALSTTFKQTSPNVHKGYEYTRVGNPTRSEFEAAVAALEGATHAAAFSSGTAVAAAILGFQPPGSHIVASDGLFGGTYVTLTDIAEHHGIHTTFADLRNPDALLSHLQPNTKLVWIETPTNPTLRLLDIPAVAEITHKHGAALVVDNTFMTPYFQTPLALGADIVYHSVTKYLNGHTDVLMGVAATNDDVRYAQLKQAQGTLGGVPAPFDCFLARRGLKTLEVRMQRHEANALALAQYLETHKTLHALDQVIYPGLPSHPQHALAKRQQRGFGAIVSIRLKHKQHEQHDPVGVFFQHLQIAQLASSLGGTETMVSLSRTMTHGRVPDDLCRSVGIDDYLVRISVGIETVEDLIEDFGQALDKAYLSP